MIIIPFHWLQLRFAKPYFNESHYFAIRVLLPKISTRRVKIRKTPSLGLKSKRAAPKKSQIYEKSAAEAASPFKPECKQTPKRVNKTDGFLTSKSLFLSPNSSFHMRHIPAARSPTPARPRIPPDKSRNKSQAASPLPLPPQSSPSCRSSTHSKVISNWNGLKNGEGLSSTTTFTMCTLAIFFPPSGSVNRTQGDVHTVREASERKLCVRKYGAKCPHAVWKLDDDWSAGEHCSAACADWSPLLRGCFQNG